MQALQILVLFKPVRTLVIFDAFLSSADIFQY